MLFNSRPAGSQADPHDAIVAQLHDLAPRITHDLSRNENAHETPQIKQTFPSADSSLPIAEPLFQAVPSNDNDGVFRNLSSPRARSHRGFLSVLLAICAGIAATMAWNSYGEQAKQTLSQLAPQFLLEVPASTWDANAVEAQQTAAQAAMPQPKSEADPAPTVETDPAREATTAALQPETPSADPVTSPTQTPPVQAALPAETAHLVEAMAGDIATLKQAVEELKANQQQLRQEIAAAAERKAHAEPVQHRAKPAPPTRQRTSPQATIQHNPPLPSPSPPQATEKQINPQRDAYIPSQAPAPIRLSPQPGDDSIPRPPMPLR